MNKFKFHALGRFKLKIIATPCSFSTEQREAHCNATFDPNDKFSGGPPNLKTMVTKLQPQLNDEDRKRRYQCYTQTLTSKTAEMIGAVPDEINENCSMTSRLGDSEIKCD